MPFAVPPYDPLPFFADSCTPVGLYARQKWLGAAGSRRWQSDFDQTVDRLRSGQSPDGSWNGSELETIQRLFGLHLTVRDPDRSVASALEWLIGRTTPDTKGRQTIGRTVVDERALAGLPFAPGATGTLFTTAALFLAAIFGHGNDPRIQAMGDALCHRMRDRQDLEPDPGSFSNALRAMVVHPVWAGHAAVHRMVAIVGCSQTADGGWNRRLPFYQTVNALAHLSGDPVDAILNRAFARLQRIQNTDGSWGTDQAEWHTFLAVHALKGKGVIVIHEKG